jgi:YD repeat-containing protein
MTTPIKICSAALAELATIDAVISCERTEKINSDNMLNFTVELDTAMTALINDTNVVGLGPDYFDIAKYTKKQNGGNLPTVTVECEHVSYRLNDSEYDLDTFTETGTPTEILTAILDGTGFTVGTVDFSTPLTCSAQEAKSRRQILMGFVATLEGEIECAGFEVSIVTARGSAEAKDLTANNNLTLISKTVDKRTLDSLGNPTISYECALYDPVVALELGDVVDLEYTLLDMDIELRIVSLTTNPYDDLDVSFEVGNYVNALEDDLYRIETSTVSKEKVYNGCRIGPDYGFQVERSDKKARNTMNATEGNTLEIGDGEGNYVPVFYVTIDEVTGVAKLYIDGTVSAVSILGAVVPDILYFGEVTEVGQCRIDSRVDGFRIQAHQEGNYLDLDDDGSLVLYIDDAAIAQIQADGFYLNGTKLVSGSGSGISAVETSLVYSATGVTITKDGTGEIWTWSKDGTGRITSMTSNNGRSIAITY